MLPGMLEEKGEVVDVQGEEQRCMRHVEGEEGEKTEDGVERAWRPETETQKEVPGMVEGKTGLNRW